MMNASFSNVEIIVQIRSVIMELELAKIAQMHKNKWMAYQRRQRQKRLVRELLIDYAKSSTLHGLRYIADRRLTIFEKIFWFATFVASLSICSYHITNVYVKWRTSPVIVSVNEKQVSVGMVPFPSVTICPQIKSKASVYNFTEQTTRIAAFSSEISDDEVNKYNDIALLCNYDLDTRFNVMWRTFNLSSDLNIIQTIYEVSPTSSELFIGCKIHGESENCQKLLKRVLTAEGLCYNFNGIAAKELFRNRSSFMSNITENDIPSKGWTLETGYDDSVKESYPFRGKENGAKPDLEITMYTNISEGDGLCNGMNSGYKIYLHNPVDIPESSLYYYAAIHNQVSSLAINLNILTTSETLKSYKPEIRQCYFGEEKYLRFFKIYTAKNCRFECLANNTLKKCDCVTYYMPHEIGTKICRRKDMDCVEQAHDEMVKRELQIDTESENDEYCRCLPACDSIEYDAEILKTDYDLAGFYRNFFKSTFNETLEDVFGKQVKFSKIEMYFKKPYYVSMRRSELFGWTDFVANIGGLLGVFLGFSFLSLMEVIYFLSIRLGFTLKRDMGEEKNTRNTT